MVGMLSCLTPQSVLTLSGLIPRRGVAIAVSFSVVDSGN